MQNTDKTRTRFNNMIELFKCNHGIIQAPKQVMQDKNNLEQKLNELENEVFHKLLFPYIVETLMHMSKPSDTLGTYLIPVIIACNYTSDTPSVLYEWVCNTNSELSEKNQVIKLTIMENNPNENHAKVQIQYLNTVGPGLAGAYCTVENNTKINKTDAINEWLIKNLV
jgi:hypothetical protein